MSSDVVRDEILLEVGDVDLFDDRADFECRLDRLRTHVHEIVVHRLQLPILEATDGFVVHRIVKSVRGDQTEDRIHVSLL